MKFNKKLYEAFNKKNKVFINGMPNEDGGVITLIEEDYLEFTINNKGNKEEDNTQEIVSIPLNQIFTFSEGEKKTGGLNGFNTPEDKAGSGDTTSDNKDTSDTKDKVIGESLNVLQQQQGQVTKQ